MTRWPASWRSVRCGSLGSARCRGPAAPVPVWPLPPPAVLVATLAGRSLRAGCDEPGLADAAPEQPAARATARAAAGVLAQVMALRRTELLPFRYCCLPDSSDVPGVARGMHANVRQPRGSGWLLAETEVRVMSDTGHDWLRGHLSEVSRRLPVDLRGPAACSRGRPAGGEPSGRPRSRPFRSWLACGCRPPLIFS